MKSLYAIKWINQNKKCIVKLIIKDLQMNQILALKKNHEFICC